jgi:predicted dehydrogenase
MADRKLRYGLIGYGAVAIAKYMVSAKQHRDEVVYVAFCDIIESKNRFR